MDPMDRNLNPENQNQPAARGGQYPAWRNQPLKLQPSYGVFPWWPDEEDWIHPEDVQTADQLIPSDRIFRREYYDQQYALLTYRDNFIRIRPVMWLQVETDGYEIGDQVEVKSSLGRGRPLIATIEEIRWDSEQRQPVYDLFAHGKTIHRPFRADEFQLTQQMEGHLDWRRLQLLQQARFR